MGNIHTVGPNEALIVSGKALVPNIKHTFLSSISIDVSA